jgi:hypothetical protein
MFPSPPIPVKAELILWEDTPSKKKIMTKKGSGTRMNKAGIEKPKPRWTDRLWFL